MHAVSREEVARQWAGGHLASNGRDARRRGGGSRRACSAHSDCAADEYCDNSATPTQCLSCELCDTQDAIDGSCPRCPLNWVNVTQPARGDVLYLDNTYTVAWAIDGAVGVDTFDFYLVPGGGTIGASVIRRNVAARERGG